MVGGSASIKDGATGLLMAHSKHWHSKDYVKSNGRQTVMIAKQLVQMVQLTPSQLPLLCNILAKHG